MNRAPFIDGKLYRWKDIFELRRAHWPPPVPRRQANWRYLQPCTTTAARSPSAGIRALSATKLVRKSGRSNKGEPPMSDELRRAASLLDLTEWGLCEAGRDWQTYYIRKTAGAGPFLNSGVHGSRRGRPTLWPSPRH
jgi:hypothetical protein